MRFCASFLLKVEIRLVVNERDNLSVGHPELLFVYIHRSHFKLEEDKPKNANQTFPLYGYSFRVSFRKIQTTMKVIVVLCLVLPYVLSHSWMTCPPSFDNRMIGRGGIQAQLCENENQPANTYVTHVQAGDRLKVGWTSNNHAGGYVRLSLVPYGDHLTKEKLKRNTMKFVCYGHDTRPQKTKGGDCVHPCDGRPGCQYQSNQYDVHRYDTTVGIPTNLKPGFYVLHAAMLVGNSRKPYYSCAKLKIVGGNQNFRCQSSKPILTYSCLKSGGPHLKGSTIETGTSRGDFCYGLDGAMGSVDEKLRDTPINVECDPRLSCDNSVKRDQCMEHNMMDSIMGAPIYPIQSGCHVYNMLPDPLPTCSDGEKNRDEEGVDCGGLFCAPCPTTKMSGEYYSDITQTIGNWETSANLEIQVHLIRDISQTQCWQLDLQFPVPLSFNGQPWHDGMIVEQHPDLKIMTFENNAQKNVGKGSILKVAFSVSNIQYTNSHDNRYKWSDDDLKFLTALFEVHDDVTKCHRAMIVPQ